MSIRNLVLPSVSSIYTAEYIANILWRENIAQVGFIIMVPRSSIAAWDSEDDHVEESRYYSAYVNIKQWCDSEAAYYFISQIKGINQTIKFNHAKDDYWYVYDYETDLNEMVAHYSDFITTFDDSFYGNQNIDEEYEAEPFCYDILNNRLTIGLRDPLVAGEANRVISYEPILNNKMNVVENLIQKTEWNSKIRRKENHVTIEYLNFINKHDLSAPYLEVDSFQPFQNVRFEALYAVCK